MHKLSENLKVDPAMNHATLNDGSNTPIWVSMENYDSLLCIIHSATIAASGAVTCQLRQATDGSGTDAKNITGNTTSFADSDDDTTKTIDVRAEELDVNNSFTHVGVLLTETGSGNAPMSAVFVRERARYAQETLPD